MRPNDMRHQKTCALILLLSVLLCACDGGIFGTGDPNIDISDASEGTTGGATGATTGASTDGGGDGSENTPADTTGGAAEGDSVAVDGFAQNVALINSAMTTGRNEALVRVLNLAPDDISLSLWSNSDHVIPANTVSALISVSQTTSRVEISSSVGQLLLGALDPVALANSSLSGVLIRPSANEARIDVRTYESQAGSGDTTNALIRLIVGSLPITGDENAISADIELIPVGDEATGTRILLSGQSYEDPIGDYSVAFTGDYSVQSNGQQIMLLRLESGASYSLVQINDQTNGPIATPLLVVTDSDLNE